MNAAEIWVRMQKSRVGRDVRVLAAEHRAKIPYLLFAMVALIAYATTKSQDGTTVVYRNESRPDFKDGRIFGSYGDGNSEGRDRLLSKTVQELKSAQTALTESTEKLQARLTEVERARAGGTATALNGGEGTTPVPTPTSSTGPLSGTTSANSQGNGNSSQVRMGSPPEDLSRYAEYGASRADSAQGNIGPRRSSGSWSSGGRVGRDSGGASVISFPVKEAPLEREAAVVVPAGSYVKAKLMTGVEAPEGKTYPVLLQLDYAYIVPNKQRVDLSGCFMIAKSQGDLSTERVQMQGTKLSCVSREGRMFERDVNGFVADDKDNSFAVIGSVNSKQDRVATMAFLSSVVEGVGKALQQAQTTQQTTPLGGSQSVMTGDQATYLAAGGASNAASLVTQWYLKQAQNLLPTINVGSGQDVWVVMQETVKLPQDYFRKNMKGGQGGHVYIYFSRASE